MTSFVELVSVMTAEVLDLASRVGDQAAHDLALKVQSDLPRLSPQQQWDALDELQTLRAQLLQHPHWNQLDETA